MEIGVEYDCYVNVVDPLSKGLASVLAAMIMLLQVPVTISIIVFWSSFLKYKGIINSLYLFLYTSKQSSQNFLQNTMVREEKKEEEENHHMTTLNLDWIPS